MRLLLSFQELLYDFGNWYSHHFHVFPIIHILVFHVPEFVAKWKTVGLLGEHGLESIHLTMNDDFRSVNAVRDVNVRSQVFEISNLQERN